VATVRIYKVAELLNTTSQEVLALLKRDHGIEVKSASSTIEEVVARQFVERTARQRGLTMPPAAAMFADTPAAARARKAATSKAAEPQPPQKPALPPPRLVKVARPHPAPPAAGEALEGIEGAAPAGVPAAEAPEIEAPPGLAAQPVAFVVEAPVAPAPPAEEPAEAGPAVEAATAAGEAPVVPGAEFPVAAAPALGPSARPAAAGRLVPPTLRLRVEDRAAASGAPVAPAAPAARRPVAPPVAARPATPAGPRPVGAPPMRPGAPAMRAPLPTVPRPSYAPTGYVAPSRPAVPGPAPRPGYRPSGPPRPTGLRPAAGRRRGPGLREGFTPPPLTPTAPPPVTRTITLAEGMTVKDLAEKLDTKVKDVLKKLLERRLMMTINSTIDPDTATVIAREFGADVQMRTFEQEIGDSEAEARRPEDQVTRAPVVTVMGHVDHGKTTLLDAIRETRVAEREAGGITQHIGAYAVDVNKRKVVFLDTPGHEAFTMMRARGARVTDVVILVVAADDGVMPQTKEAIDHARAAGVPILVAINKIDKPDANPDRVKKELADLGLVPEEWGGQTVTVAVSAKKRQNLELLLEMILLVTEIAELKANPKRSASGTVLEAKLDKGRGPVATVLVQDGTLHVGDNVIAGTIVGKVRALIDDRGRPTRSAAPSTPVEVLGLGGLPQPGDMFQSIADAAKARQIAVFRQNQAREKAQMARQPRLTLESLKQQIAEGGMKELPIVIKADVQGSAEVLADTLAKLSDESVKIRIIRAGVGAINESDVLLASASNAIVIGFNVRPDRNAGDLAEHESVDVRLHSVIYNVTDEIKKAMEGLLEPTLKEVRLGLAEVRQLFKVPKVGTVAGCMVLDGVIKRAGDAQARLLRDNVVVYEGKLGSLKRFKDDVAEVKSGFECGMSFERFHDLKVGDVIEAFVVQSVEAAAS